MSGSSLFPGYKQVQSFSPDAECEQHDGEVEEEVEYVTLDLGSVEPTLVPSTSSYRLIGLDTPTPFLQLSGTILKGQHQTILGTELLFTEAKDDVHDRGKRSLVHVGTTEKRIRFREVELKPKNIADSTAAHFPEPIVSGKRRAPEGVDEVAGNTVAPSSSRGGRIRGRGHSRGRGRGGNSGDLKMSSATAKGKERAVEGLAPSFGEDGPDDAVGDGPDFMDTAEG